MSKQFQGNFFEDFELGQTLVHGTPRTITEGDAALYIALTGSRQLLHSAAPVAHAMGLRDKTVDDLLAFHIAFGKTVPDVSLNAVANLGYADVRFLQPVYVGDTLQAESTVVGLKQNSNGKTGVVYVRSTALNQRRDEVISWIRWVMVRKRDLDRPAPPTLIPHLPDHVKPARLAVPRDLSASGFETELTGSPYLWEDYDVGERIDHINGMTVDESDHTLATKLYQNNARVHFEEFMMKDSRFGRRLMYGGHVISLVRALSYNGLANALTIAAINGGAHTNPCFGGDTVYAFSTVVDKWPLSGRDDLGALRVRSIGVKNQDTREIDQPSTIVDGREKYPDNVLLDLDYTVLMPRRT